MVVLSGWVVITVERNWVVSGHVGRELFWKIHWVLLLYAIIVSVVMDWLLHNFLVLVFIVDNWFVGNVLFCAAMFVYWLLINNGDIVFNWSIPMSGSMLRVWHVVLKETHISVGVLVAVHDGVWVSIVGWMMEELVDIWMVDRVWHISSVSHMQVSAEISMAITMNLFVKFRVNYSSVWDIVAHFFISSETFMFWIILRS